MCGRWLWMLTGVSLLSACGGSSATGPSGPSGPPVVTLAIIFTGLFLMSISLDKYANPRLKGATRG